MEPKTPGGRPGLAAYITDFTFHRQLTLWHNNCTEIANTVQLRWDFLQCWWFSSKNWNCDSKPTNTCTAQTQTWRPDPQSSRYTGFSLSTHSGKQNISPSFSDTCCSLCCHWKHFMLPFNNLRQINISTSDREPRTELLKDQDIAQLYERTQLNRLNWLNKQSELNVIEALLARNCHTNILFLVGGFMTSHVMANDIMKEKKCCIWTVIRVKCPPKIRPINGWEMYYVALAVDLLDASLHPFSECRLNITKQNANGATCRPWLIRYLFLYLSLPTF